MERETDIANLARRLTNVDPATTLRIGVVTAIQATLGRRVQTSITGLAWIPRSEDANLSVGDRVWMLQQGSVWIVGGRLSGDPGSTPIGVVMHYAGVAAPDGWLACDGSAVSRTTYATLYAVMGTAYGVGDGSTTFNLPDLRERVAVGTGAGRARASVGGAASVALSVAQLPGHTHTAGVGTGTTVVMTGTGATVSNGTAATSGSTGSGSTHENMPPFQVLLAIVRAI